jgi:hypothetical protein
MIDATQHEAFSKMKRFPPWYSQRYVRENGSLGGKPDRFIIASVALKTPSKTESTWMRIGFVLGW